MNTSLFCPLQTWISEAMLEAEGGWGKYPKQGTRARKREIRVRESKGKYAKVNTHARIRKAAERLAQRTNINQ